MEICYRVTVDLGEVINSSAPVSSSPTRLHVEELER